MAPPPLLTLFQSYAWNEIAARVFAARERTYVVVAESDIGAAIIPACVGRDSVSLLGEELFDYRDVITSGDPTLTDSAWEKVRGLGLPLEVKAVRGDCPWAESKPFAGAPYRSCELPVETHYKLERNLRLLAKDGCVLRSQGLKPNSFLNTFHPAEAGCSPGPPTFITCDQERQSGGLATLAEALPLDWASPAATAPLGVTDGKLRPESMFQMQIPRRCAPRNDKPEMGENDKPEIGDAAAIIHIVRRMYELKARNESGSLFRDPLRIEAVVEMAESAPSEVFTIENENEMVAAVLTFIDGNVCRFYGTYYDERWARYSPGVSLLYRVIQQAQARGFDFDFMTGEQAYKMRFAREVVPLYIASGPVTAQTAA